MASVWSIPNALTYICVLGVYHVSAQFCLKNSDGSRNCTVDNCDPPKLPPFPDLWQCTNNTNLTETLSPCLPEVTTTQQPTSTFAKTTAAETSSPDTENVTTPTTATPGAGLQVWLIVLIVFASLLGGLVILFVVYYVVKKKNDTCKVHCESEANDSSTDKGKLMVLKYHDRSRGSIVLEPVVAPLHHPSCNAPPALRHHSTDQLDNSNPRTASGAQVILTPHAADPIESQDSRNRTFSAGSQAGDTSLLVGESAATGQLEPKSQKKKKKKKKSKDSKQLELGPIQNKGMAYDPAKTTEDV